MKKTLRFFHELATIFAIVAFFFLGYDAIKNHVDTATVVFLVAFIASTVIAFLSGIIMHSKEQE